MGDPKQWLNKRSNGRPVKKVVESGVYGSVCKKWEGRERGREGEKEERVTGEGERGEKRKREKGGGGGGGGGR